LGFVEKTVLEKDLIEQPGRTFNEYKTSLQLDDNPEFFLSKRGSKDINILTSVEKGETKSVIACCSAECHYFPPVCSLKDVKKKQEFEDGSPQGSAIIISETVIVTSDILTV
jgi:hypothetical protein